MVLSNTELEKLVTNCVKTIRGEGDSLQFQRFTDKQLELYASQNYARASGCNTGICIDFIYSGKYISFEFLPVVLLNGWYISIDLYEDDKFVQNFLAFSSCAGMRKFEHTFDEAKERRIRIFLPYICGIEIWKFTLDDGSTYRPTPTEGRKKLLILGDSITQGYDTFYTTASYAGMLQTHFDAVSINQGVGGYFFCADSIDSELDFEPDAITVAYGTNDWTRYKLDEEKLRAGSKAYIDKLCKTYPNAKIFGILPLWRAETEKRKDTHIPYSRVYDILTEHYSAHKNVTIIDGRHAVPHDVNFFADGLHPEAVGHVLYGKHVICEMEKAGFHK